VIGYPCLVDAGETVSVSLADTAETAKRLTRRGLIRLFAIACKDEITARLRALPDADAMYKLYGTIGETAEFKRDLASLICEKTFLDPRLGDEPRTKQEFEDRQAAQWGRLGGNTIEMGRLVHSVLTGRQKVAHRLSAGTPKQWEASIADLREHMAWLIPPGAFALVPLARLMHYPRYVDGMHKRLEKLREGGTAKEAVTLPAVLASWKRLTGYIAQQHAEQKKHDAQLPPETGIAPIKTGPAGNPRSGLNTSLGKRTKVVIASDDAAWCMHMLGEGLMDVNFENYRWLLEEFRIASFAQELGTAQPASQKRLDELWGKVRS
jgi:ATP-dependent helicase HrpA